MKIAVISPVWFPVPPTGYGGIEWIVWLLADGLVDAGHDVTLFASGDSTTKAKLVSVYDTAPSELIGTSVVEIHHCLACFERAADFDVINDHSGLPAAASSPCAVRRSPVPRRGRQGSRAFREGRSPTGPAGISPGSLRPSPTRAIFPGRRSRPRPNPGHPLITASGCRRATVRVSPAPSLARTTSATSL